jgi:WD40 repeat protein
MGDVFISYSRRDKDFVRRLHDAFARVGRNMWVDWKDIPPSAEWMKEIHAAIENAEAILFVISSHSAASNVCAQEVLHAVGNNKRLIPVVREHIDPALLSQPVADRNWIFFRETDDFDRSVTQLLNAIDVDLEWTKRHTRLLTRAIEWQNHDRDAGYALHGSDLRESERDLKLSESKEPGFTGLQIQYVLESRRHVNRRRNIAISAAGIAAAVLIVVGLLFWQKRHENNLNLAQNFSANAVRELTNGDPLVAEVYFARSLIIDDQLRTREMLLQARARSAPLLWTAPSPTGTDLLAFSPDGTRYLRHSGEGLELWDVSSRQRVQSLPIGKEKLLAVAFSRDMRLLVVGSAASISVWSIQPSATAPTASFPGWEALTSLALAPSEDLIIAGSLDGTLSIFDLNTQQREPVRIRSHQQKISSLTFTANGQFLASASFDNTVKLWTVAAGEAQRTLAELRTLAAHYDAALSVAFSPDGETIASGGWDNRIWLWDRNTGQRLRQLRGHAGGIVALAFSADGQWLASGSEDRKARIWVVDTGRALIELPGLDGDVVSLAFTGAPRGHQLAAADEKGTIRLWDLDAIGQREELVTLRGHQRPVNAIMFNPRREQLASGSWDRTVRLWDVKTLAQRVLGTAHADSVYVVAFSPDASMLLSGGKDGVIRVWDIASGASRLLERNADSTPAIVRDIAFSADGKLIASANDDGHVRIWNASDRHLLQDFAIVPERITPEKVYSVAFNPDGRLLATASEDHQIRIWRVADWTLLHTLCGHEKEVWQVTFSPDGRLLFSASDDRTARVWDSVTGQQIGPPLPHEAPVWSVDVSPDGKTLLTGSSDSLAHLWTITGSSGSVAVARRFTLRLSDEPIWKVTFSHLPGDSRLAISGGDGNIYVLDLARLEALLKDPAKLEREAITRSGLEIAPGPELRIAPVRVSVIPTK